MKSENIEMAEISIAGLCEKLVDYSCIDDQLLLIDKMNIVPWPTLPRRMRCLMVGICTKGSANYSVNTVAHTIHPNDVIIIYQDSVVDRCSVSDNFEGLVIMMSQSFFSEIIKGVHELAQLFLFSRMHPVFRLRPSEASMIEFYCSAVKSRMDSTEHHFRTEVVRSFLQAMIYDISNVIYRLQQSGGQQATRAEAIFSKFIMLVEENFRTERRVSWYARQMCITPKYLSESVKMASQRTPNDWIDNYVTLEMRVLLKNSTMSIKEISQQLNFPNQSFLGKFFKEHVGMSPSEYRKK